MKKTNYKKSAMYLIRTPDGGLKKLGCGYCAPDDEQIKKWKEMTFWNEHSEVMVEIAAWFQSESKRTDTTLNHDYKAVFDEILRLHMKEESLTSGLCKIRNLAWKTMTSEIECKCGVEILQRVLEGCR